MNKKAFTLIELGIVLVIIGIVMGSLISMGGLNYKNSQRISTKSDLESIKTSLLSYASAHGGLPYPDNTSDGEGDITALGTLGNLPFIDLQVKSTDAYGQTFHYAVWDKLLTSDTSTICTVLKGMALADAPSVADDSGNIKYQAAVLVISNGEDKALSSTENADGDRVYEMSQNVYDATTNDDIVMELSIYELLGTLCDL